MNERMINRALNLQRYAAQYAKMSRNFRLEGDHKRSTLYQEEAARAYELARMALHFASYDDE